MNNTRMAGRYDKSIQLVGGLPTAAQCIQRTNEGSIIVLVSLTTYRSQLPAVLLSSIYLPLLPLIVRNAVSRVVIEILWTSCERGIQLLSGNAQLLEAWTCHRVKSGGVEIASNGPDALQDFVIDVQIVCDNGI